MKTVTAALAATFLLLGAGSVFADATATADATAPREKLAEIKDTGAAPGKQSVSNAATNIPAKGNFNRAGTLDANAPVQIDTGNNHSTGSAAIVRSGVGVNNNVTGVSSGLR